MRHSTRGPKRLQFRTDPKPWRSDNPTPGSSADPNAYPPFDARPLNQTHLSPHAQPLPEAQQHWSLISTLLALLAVALAIFLLLHWW